MATAEELNPKKILMVAGEASGDLHGAHLMGAIHRLDPRVEFLGVGGERMERMGMKCLYPSQSLSVVGITEVFRRLGSILKAFQRLKQCLIQERPDLVILIDFPDFNLRIAKFAHRKGIRVLYYISPQVWAWRPGRVKLIAKWVEKMVVLFSFEVPLYKAEGVDVEWVGHPLLDLVKGTLPKNEAFRRFGLDPKRRTIGLLPGSRVHEVERLLPVLVTSAQLIQDSIPDIQFVIPLAPEISRTTLSPWINNPSVSIKVVEGFPYDVMNLSDLLLTASGTATLEGAILGKPMIIIYKVSFLTYWVGRILIQVDHIGLANLVAEKKIVPELIQNEASPQRIAEEAVRILRDPTLVHSMTEAMREVRQRLGDPGAAERAANIVCSMLNRPCPQSPRVNKS